MAMQEYLIMAAERVLRRAKGSAALVWYSNDTVTQTCFGNVVGNLVFVKKARRSGEFVVQRMFVHAASSECAAVLCEPEWVEDKAAATQCECYRRLFAHLWSMKIGILLSTFVWDGALHSSCDRLHRQYKANSKPKLTSSTVTAC